MRSNAILEFSVHNSCLVVPLKFQRQLAIATRDLKGRFWKSIIHSLDVGTKQSCYHWSFLFNIFPMVCNLTYKSKVCLLNLYLLTKFPLPIVNINKGQITITLFSHKSWLIGLAICQLYLVPPPKKSINSFFLYILYPC